MKVQFKNESLQIQTVFGFGAISFFSATASDELTFNMRKKIEKWHVQERFKSHQETDLDSQKYLSIKRFRSLLRS